MKKFYCTVLSALIVMSAVLCGCSDNGSKDSTSDKSDSKTSTAVTDTTVKTTGQKIHMNDSTLGEIWITELDGVPVNKLENKNFSSDNSFKYYSENGKPASMEGIDVSSYSGSIDWGKVKNSGVDFAMIRIGGRGYGDDGALYADDKAIENIKNAQSVGIRAGVYFFSQAITTEEAVEEADYIKKLLGDIKPDFPVAYDWEIIKDEDARTDDITPAQTTACAKAFCTRIKEYGFTPIIYSPSKELYFKYDLTQLADFDIWYCEYSDVPVFYYQFSMWQYSSTGTVDGIEGDVDLNICFTSIADYD